MFINALFVYAETFRKSQITSQSTDNATKTVGGLVDGCLIQTDSQAV